MFDISYFRDALIVAIANCLTSIFAGFVIFSTIGFMAHQAGKSVGNVASAGILTLNTNPKYEAEM